MALIAVILLLPTEIVVLLVLRSDLLLSILSTIFILLFFPLIYKGMIHRTKVGPILAWFSPRTEKVWVKIDEDDFVVRLPGKREA